MNSAFISFKFFTINLTKSIISLIKVIVKFKYLNNPKPLTFSNKCLIIGNGPSLNDSLPEIIAKKSNYDLFAVNNFASSEAYSILEPKFYIILDGAYFNDKTIGNRQDIQLTIESLIKKTNWELNIFIPIQAKKTKFKNHMNHNNNIKINYFNYNVIDGFYKLQHFLYNINLGFPRCNNVLAASILCALKLPYKDVFIVGADHSWIFNLTIDNENNVLLNQKHFYDINNTSHQKILLPTTGKTLNIADFFISQAKAFETYYFIEHLAQSKKVKIYNASKFSLIDAFKRINKLD